MSDFHNTPFDDSTKLKLEIYRKYLEDWLPVFAVVKMPIKWSGRINVFDFFCGPGRDPHGEVGSPIVAINSSKKYMGLLVNHNRKVSLFFSDKAKSKTQQLKTELESINLPENIEYSIQSGEFIDVFESYSAEMENSPNLLFIDQCGIKEVNKKVFNRLTNLPKSDFLFFFASSHFWRFKDSNEFKSHIELNNLKLDDVRYSDIHRLVAEMYRSWLNEDKEYYIAPFTLKKGPNIHGLIFGCSNLLGIEKFLRICWQIDPERGEANFDIDGDNLHNYDLFKDNNTSNKVREFEEVLLCAFKEGKLNTDLDVFRFSLENGFLPVKHAKPIVTQLIKDGVLVCPQQPRLSKICVKEPRLIKLSI